MSFSSLENTHSSSSPESNNETKFNRGMLSATADELVHIIMNLDAIQFKTMFDQTRSVLIDQEDELKKRQEKIMELESKVSWNLETRTCVFYRFFFAQQAFRECVERSSLHDFLGLRENSFRRGGTIATLSTHKVYVEKKNHNCCFHTNKTYICEKYL
jgi:hypothetical protein